MVITIVTKEQIYSALNSLAIEYQIYEHPPLFTAKEARELCSNILGPHVKNLFLRNKKKKFYALVTAREDKQVDLRSLADGFKVGRFSFANDDD